MYVKHLGLALVFFTLASACGPHSQRKRAVEVDDLPGAVDAASGDWYNLDSSLGGINVDQAYHNGRYGHEVIVAVIDSGVSVTHPDLAGHIWTNPKEIANNGIDDDGNGYIDDIHGWNYLVARDGTNIVLETLEVTREMRRLTQLAAERELSADETAYFAEVRRDFERWKTAAPDDPRYDLDWQQRADDPADFTPISLDHPAYGNNQVDDLNGHGTHVAGIIAADRHNGIGIRGVADNARIMVLRVVPAGDEQDKDIYHAVRYAVDQGARVINMSFGKEYSPYPEKVQEAFLYAYERGVLLVHASGNSGDDMDKALFYPSRAVNEGQPFNDGWLEVGAVERGTQPSRAGFSNYGHRSVDIFAPGVSILSTVPGAGYRSLSGTSMATPVAAGVAALALSAFPDIMGKDLRTAILESARQSASLQNQAIVGGVIDAAGLMQDLQKKRGSQLEPSGRH